VDKLVILERLDAAGVRAVADELGIKTATVGAIHREARDRIVVVSWPGYSPLGLEPVEATIVWPPNNLHIEDLWALYHEWAMICAPDFVVRDVGGGHHANLTLGDEVFAGDNIIFRPLLREELVYT